MRKTESFTSNMKTIIKRWMICAENQNRIAGLAQLFSYRNSWYKRRSCNFLHTRPGAVTQQSLNYSNAIILIATGTRCCLFSVGVCRISSGEELTTGWLALREPSVSKTKNTFSRNSRQMTRKAKKFAKRLVEAYASRRGKNLSTEYRNRVFRLELTAQKLTALASNSSRLLPPSVLTLRPLGCTLLAN